jgi:hypothetical protein
MHRLDLKKRGMSRTSYQVNSEQGKRKSRQVRHVDPRGREGRPHDSMDRNGRLDLATLLFQEDTGEDVAFIYLARHLLYLLLEATTC